jgi:hypothetical protein
LAEWLEESILKSVLRDAGYMSEGDAGRRGRKAQSCEAINTIIKGEGAPSKGRAIAYGRHP